ncbi:MAG: hypothetical protein ACLGI7_03895 [Gammaproteobacteria bacterium]
MRSDRSEPRNLRQVLSQTQPNLGGTLERARQLADINRALRDWCDDAWVHQVRLANVRGDTAVLYSASASALVPLRHHSRSLLAWLNTRYHLSCTRIEAKVRPPATDVTAAVYRPAPRSRKPSG